MKMPVSIVKTRLSPNPYKLISFEIGTTTVWCHPYNDKPRSLNYFTTEIILFSRQAVTLNLLVAVGKTKELFDSFLN